jgi:hypothetical protein
MRFLLPILSFDKPDIDTSTAPLFIYLTQVLGVKDCTMTLTYSSLQFYRYMKTYNQLNDCENNSILST